jgi:hypothetical protein
VRRAGRGRRCWQNPYKGGKRPIGIARTGNGAAVGAGVTVTGGPGPGGDLRPWNRSPKQSRPSGPPALSTRKAASARESSGSTVPQSSWLSGRTRVDDCVCAPSDDRDRTFIKDQVAESPTIGRCFVHSTRRPGTGRATPGCRCCRSSRGGSHHRTSTLLTSRWAATPRQSKHRCD